MMKILVLAALLLSPRVNGFVSPPTTVKAPTKSGLHFVGYGQKRDVVKLPASSTSFVATLEEAFNPSRQPGFVSRIIRVANHVPAFISLYYFGLVSMANMMPGVMPLQPTLASVLTRYVGPTTSRQFSSLFPTLVTPPPSVFLVWPAISLVQLATLLYSALRPIRTEAVLSQDNLSALAMANLASTWWLTSASGATAATGLPLSCFLILPLVPIASSYPLRRGLGDPNRVTAKNCAFQLYSSFTTLASFLALAVELQHGGRLLPFPVPAELAASAFLGLYYLVVSFKNKSPVKKIVQAAAITGIGIKRIQEAVTLGGATGLSRLLLSVSFYGTIFVAYKAIQKLLDSN